MNYKLPFFILATGMIVASIIPFGMSQSPEDAFMEIDLLVGQTEYPFRIQDTFDQNVFGVKPNGGLDPLPIIDTEFTMTREWWSEVNPTWSASSPNIIAPNAESGAGVYQFSHVVTASDVDNTVDSAGIWTRDLFSPSLVFQYENLDGSTIGSGISLFINDVEFGRATRDISGGNFGRGNHQDRCIHDGRCDTIPYAVEGDVIGVKIFQTSGVASSLQLNHIWLLGHARLTTVALGFAVGNNDPNLQGIRLELDIPAILSGETFVGNSQCTVPAYNDWSFCLANPSDDTYQGVIGSQWFMESNDGTVITNTASDNLIMFNDQYLREGGTLKVVTWK